MAALAASMAQATLARPLDNASISAGTTCLRSSFLGSACPSVSTLTRTHNSTRRCRAVPQAKIREIFMPALSSTMTEGKIVSWAKSEGDKLSKGESVVVVESDKADMDVETFYEGFLAAILVDEGEVAPVGAAIGLLAETEAEIEEAKQKAASSSGSAPTSADPAPPPPASEDSTPSPVPVAAVAAGSVASSGPVVVSSHPAAEGGRIVATPYAKKLGRELGVNLATVAGTGPQGRIVAADVERAAAALAAAPPPVVETAVAAPPPPPPTPVPAAAPLTPAVTSPPPGVSYTVVPFTPMQAAVSRNMIASLAIPVSRVGYRIVTNEFDDLQKKLKSKGVTTTVLLAKAVALALAQHPVMNACCRDGASFHYNPSINVAVAVAMDGGLITPVLFDADKTDIFTLSSQWRELVNKARAKKLSPNEYSGGTFTLSNLGMYGVDRFDAILPVGTGAIMAVGASLPVVLAQKNNSFAVRRQMQVNVTADHRIIYGADVAAFLKTLGDIIENPAQLTL